jgi:hypothetical protein
VRDLTPERVDQALNEKIVETSNALKQFRKDLKRLEDRKECRVALDDLPDPEDALDLEDMALLEAIFDDPLRPGSPTRQWRKRRKR